MPATAKKLPNKTAAKPAQKPAVKPPLKAVVKSPVKSAAKPALKPAAKATAKPAAKPAAKPVSAKPASAKIANPGKLKIPTKLPGFVPKAFAMAAKGGNSSSAKTAGKSSNEHPRLQAMLDRQDIEDLLYSYCRAVDRGDENLLRSSYHPDATEDRGPGLFQGLAHDFVVWYMGVLNGIKLSNTMLTNVRIDLRGDVALVESLYFTHNRLDKPTGKEDLFIGGRFLDRLERRPSGASGVWKIAHRKTVIDWTRTVAAADIFYIQNPDALWGVRGRADFSYQMENFPAAGQGRTQAFIGKAYNPKSAKF